LSASVPILDERRAEIEKIEKQTFKYGQRHRDNLDVYYPDQPILIPNAKVPVLFFVYGGSYNTGSRQFPPPYEMGYRALGSFFAQHGFITVIPDYRLVPEARFPAASQDIRDAIIWVKDNAKTIRSSSTSTVQELDPEHFFVMGHSAGAAHIKVMTMYEELRKMLPPLRGVIWNAGP
ncbi:Alpha/Beta hydrolase protein, partial [Pisolithus marmoratus]